MGTVGDRWDECSVIGDEGEIGYLDYEDDKSVCSYNPNEEGPVVVSVPFPFVNGKPQSVFVEEIASDSITLKNTTHDPVDLWGIKIYASNPVDSFTLSLMKRPPKNSDVETVQGFLESFALDDRTLQPGETLTVWLSCKPKEIGVYTSVVHFDLGDERIERVVFLLADDKISQSLACRNPYLRSRRQKHSSVDSFVRGPHPAMKQEQSYKNRLPRYDIPKDIRELLESKQIPDVVMEGLWRETYGLFFKTLLVMEELQLEEDVSRYDMECVTLRKRGPYLSLEVPGLAERRPSLVHGDFILAKLTSENRDDTAFQYHQGYIHRVEADEVFLKFAPEFHRNHTDSNSYYVRFKYNRVNMRRLYQAIDAAEMLDIGFLFPSEFSKRRLNKINPLVPISPHLNPEQTRSIEMILGCKGMPPYVIIGPPGTGKTMTLVEAVLQLCKTREKSRILVCAPSNSAADHILEKFLCENAYKVQESEIFRLNASSRPYEDLKPDHIRFCFFIDQIFKCPPLVALSRYRIIISTYMSASLLFAEGVQRGHFSHIFLDEAGQASEPETMVPLSNFCKRNTVVVLAGDPMQLGPVVYSKEAEGQGLGKSYLQRIFESEPYNTKDENYVTKLIKNYRCHPSILHLPSILFYEGELIACKEDINSLVSTVDLLPNREFPVLFLGIQGCDEREGNNPSWFNRIEASKVVDIIKRLMTTVGDINEEDIGVITPYRQQVLKLNMALESLDMPDIKVGSVEQFQGQEKKVIIVSTVRSTIKHNEFDRIHCLGFLSNPRRFNVAITRAISLLIVIGNPHIISADPFWNKLLWYCVDKNSYQGCGLPERQEFVDKNPSQDDEWNYNEENHVSSEKAASQQEFKPDETSWSDGWNNDSVQTDIKPVTDGAPWSDGWNNDCVQTEINPVTDATPRSDDIDSVRTEIKPVTNGASWSDGWNNDSVETEINPVTNATPWSDGWKEDWKEDYAQTEIKPVTDEAQWSDGWKQDSFKTEPVTDETEWSDGWKS